MIEVFQKQMQVKCGNSISNNHLSYSSK